LNIPDKKLEKYITENQILSDNTLHFFVMSGVYRAAGANTANSRHFHQRDLTAACQLLLIYELEISRAD
jgi:sulfur relay (sulfurtransferase) DsrF/TusC family protein